MVRGLSRIPSTGENILLETKEKIEITRKKQANKADYSDRDRYPNGKGPTYHWMDFEIGRKARALFYHLCGRCASDHKQRCQTPSECGIKFPVILDDMRRIMPSFFAHHLEVTGQECDAGKLGSRWQNMYRDNKTGKIAVFGPEYPPHQEVMQPVLNDVWDQLVASGWSHVE